ncbi:hypothetical protein DAEQUDRAFT_722574 [Daedalea quercina L-15889]|uniref:Uncharacterized protein n=1 Tax=Daedalea quercina L-15889 TaxID=1314783 RepID=A0A165T562_9APHY|nr:hypothetical protein DAEQUDRAFT_722574 [Daedalea quercina L-15889]
MATPAHPVASSSRLPPIPSSALYPLSDPAGPPPSRTNSSSTVASLSPEPTPLGPLTPPDLSDPHYKPYHSPPATLDYFDRPPSPPRSLKDQMQVAYALDDMHLAKVLYLKLQGVEVTGDDDPRIAAVKDEDFSSSFVPCGKLELDENVARRCREEEKRERERRRRAQREARLRACERIWEGNAAWLREENAKVARRKEEEVMQRRRLSQEAREREREREREARERELETLRHTRQVRFSALTQRPLLDYSTLSHERCSTRSSLSRSPEEHSLQSSFMPYSIPRHSPPTHRSISPPDQNSLTLQRLQHEFAQSLSHTVRFAEVVASMRGPLFPTDGSPALRLQAKMSRSQRELFDSLFDSDDGEDERVPAKGKAREGMRSKRASVQAEATGRGCVACSLGTRASSSMPSSGSAISSSASTITRSNSWFSFGSRSSASTALTTPSSSLLSFKSSSQSLSPILSSSVLHTEPESIRHSCQHRPLVPVPTAEGPLCPPANTSASPQKDVDDPLPGRGRPRIRGSGRLSTIPEVQSLEDGLVKRVGRSVSTLMDMAAQFQRAYVKATLFSVGTDFSRSRSDSRGSSGSRSPSRSPWRTRRASASAPRPSGRRPGKLRPEGYRALALDVAFLLSATLDDELSGTPHPTRTLIPLALRLPGAEAGLPCHGRVFPAPMQPPRSPFRVAQPQPGAPSLPRLRPVANPVLLRLQALQNICAVRALTWEGRPQEGRMCAGKEKLVGIAWEGIGRSSLGWEVTAVVY